MSKKMLSKKDAGAATSIHSIAKQLRGENENSNVSQDLSKSVKNESRTNKEEVLNENLNGLFEVLKNSNYNCKSILYVDDDIKEVFALIKSKEKISISTLVSYILEKWIEEHIDEITSIINNNSNRFL